MAPELRTQANHRLVTGLAALLKGAEPASDKQTVLARTLVAAARKDLAVELIQGWLEGEEVPPGLAIDTDMRWNIVTALAKLGVADEAVVEAELQRDRTNAGVERAAGARAGMPTARAKAEAWQLATQDPSVPNETHRSICMGFWRYHQEEVLAPYVERYLDVAGAISRREGTWAQRGYAAISTVLRWLFPDQLIDAELVQRYRDWLETSEPSQQVQRLMSERLDEAERCLAVREVSRHEGA